MRAWREDWTEAVGEFPPAELAALIRLLTVAEAEIPGWSAGSVSPVIWLFRVYAQRAGAEEESLADWVLRHTSNDYLPYGSSNYGARSLEELRTRRDTAATRSSERAAIESERQDQGRTRRSVDATRNIFGAIRRGDAAAVQALLGHGADLRARDADGRTPYDLAVALGHEVIALLLRDEG